MKPKRRPMPHTVPRYIAQRVVSWYESLTASKIVSRPILRLTDINGRRWTAKVLHGCVYVELAIPYHQFTPTLFYEPESERATLSRITPQANPFTAKRALYETSYCNFIGLDKLYAEDDRRVRYPASPMTVPSQKPFQKNNNRRRQQEGSP